MLAALVLPLAAGLIWGAIHEWRERAFAWRHRAVRLDLDERGLVFRDRDTLVRAAWDEVRAVGPLERREGWSCFRVETRGGEFVMWNLHNSKIWGRFRRRCEIYAPGALEAVRAGESELGLDQPLDARWVDENGAATFSYRTRGNRLMLFCFSLVPLLAPLFYLINAYGRADDAPFAPSWTVFWGLAGAGALTLGALWIWFAKTRFVANEDGLELRSPFRSRRRIAWRSVEAVGRDAWGDWLRADGRTIRLTLLLPLARRAQWDEMMRRRGVSVGPLG